MYAGEIQTKEVIPVYRIQSLCR